MTEFDRRQSEVQADSRREHGPADAYNFAFESFPGGMRPETQGLVHVPMVVEHTNRGPKSYDIFSRLLEARIVLLDSVVTDQSACIVNAQLLYLSSINSKDDIELHLNSPGGSVTAGLAIYDQIQYIKPDVKIVVRGQAASMGAVLLSGGAKGKRCALPNARIMIHQVRGGFEGLNSDCRNNAKEMDRLNDLLMNIIAENTGQPIEKVRQDFMSDTYLNAQEALEYGIIDQVIEPRQKDSAE